MPGRLRGFYPQGRGFSSAFSAASAVRFFHPVDARWFSPGFSFSFICFIEAFLGLHLCNCGISLLNKHRAASSEHAIAYAVLLLLSRTGMVSERNLNESASFHRELGLSYMTVPEILETMHENDQFDMLRVFSNVLHILGVIPATFCSAE